MKKIVFMVHGILSFNGSGQTKKLRPYWEAEGWEVIDFDYGFHEVLWCHFNNHRLSLELVDRVLDRYKNEADKTGLAPYVVCLGHSNGCRIIQLATRVTRMIRQCVFISPALDQSARVGNEVAWVHIWHSPTDPATGLARFIPGSPWGDMGSVGYQPKKKEIPDARMINYNKSTYGPGSYSHLDMFFDQKLDYFGPRILGYVEERVGL